MIDFFVFAFKCIHILIHSIKSNKGKNKNSIKVSDNVTSLPLIEAMPIAPVVSENLFKLVFILKIVVCPFMY